MTKFQLTRFLEQFYYIKIMLLMIQFQFNFLNCVIMARFH